MRHTHETIPGWCSVEQFKLYEKMARELLPYTNNRYGIIQNVRRQTHLKTLSDIANEHAIGSVQRRTIQHFIAEMQAIEY